MVDASQPELRPQSHGWVRAGGYPYSLGVTAIRLPLELIRRIDAWAASKRVGRSAAIRDLTWLF